MTLKLKEILALRAARRESMKNEIVGRLNELVAIHSGTVGRDRGIW